jgi:putative transcriptional regulator
MIYRMWSAEEIKALREQYGEKQRIFAECRLGVSVDTLRYWEQGRGVPSGPAAKLLERLKEDIEAGRAREIEQHV